MKVTSCTGCGASMRWVFMPSGKRNPVDVVPVANGNILIDGEDADGVDVGHVMTKVELELGGWTLDAPEPPDRYVSHFSTCPKREKFRR